ncbi:hypothetical protein [Labrys monachus]|uniref:Surface antigen n=1 Tax=Labrys monachus TaxID=217067 RepID=A0ABU0FIU8_9HYPH|nr:hypothetical protein [Labrys monachus]MDQ0394542.1 surface antigen [Labrys monachus]
MPLIGLVLLALPLAGCQTSSGAVTPALATGPVLSDSPILAGLDHSDRVRAEQARLSALDGKAGQSVNWTSDESAQRHGAVVAGPLSNQNGMPCRPYTQTVYVEGVPSVARATACRQADGSWRNS